MIYLWCAAALGLGLIGFLMVKLWELYYGEGRSVVMTEEERLMLDETLAPWGAQDPIRVRRLFEGELLWSEGSPEDEPWRWSWESGRRTPQAYTRLSVTFVQSLGQGIVLSHGKRGLEKELEQGQLGPRIVELEADIMPEHIVCRARDEERLEAFIEQGYVSRLVALDGLGSAFYFDDRRMHIYVGNGLSHERLEALLVETFECARALIEWSSERGLIPALQMGQYQGALADLEQASVRDSLSAEDAVQSSTELPDAPT